MAKDKIDALEQKKRELEVELEQIQLELDDSIHRVRSDVSNRLDPVRFLREHPWPVFGVSFLAGFLLSGNGKKKDHSPSTSPAKASSSDSEKIFSPMLFKELKRMAARKAVSMAGEYLDEILKSRRSPTISNGEKV